MLILVLLLTFTALIHQSSSINLTYILKKGKNGVQPGCIAEELERYSAVGWIFPLPTNESGLPNATTKFIPSIHNDFNCKFGKNDRCNRIWSIKNWQVDDKSPKTLDLILDNRWEDLPTIFTNREKDFKERIELPHMFHLGFSVRTNDSIELVISEGWNPYNYACYYVLISPNQIFLRKFQVLPKIIPINQPPLDSYTAYSSIISEDEWRNFVISLDENGTVTLTDANLKRTVIQYQDKEPLKPLYFLMRSNHTALWKIHQNNFMYTKSVQMSRLGPTLGLSSKDLCVTLYVATCPNCIMTFITMKDNQRHVLKEVGPVKDNSWTTVKLKDTNILTDKLNIFVETKFVNQSDTENGFWAIDDVRICHENEVKVTLLSPKTNIGEDEATLDRISCQIVKLPKWRPKKLTYSRIEGFPHIESSSSSTSISLFWKEEDPSNEMIYFISYEANDLCTSEPHNMRRIKSNGLLMTKHNEITIEDLVPYTTYNITLSSTLHEMEKMLTVATLETDLPTPEELPNRVQVQVTDNAAYVSWDQIHCTSIYGHIFYAINVTNMATNQTSNLTIQTENSVQINDLEPFTLHTLNIVTARSYENIVNKKNTVQMSVSFTTKPGVAPPVENVEVYASDKKSVSLRYDLPKNTRGVPVSVQITRCYAVWLPIKCKATQMPVTRCPLWPKKHCIEIDNLIPYHDVSFRISLRNDHTNSFGESVVARAHTREQEPAPPSNITYKIVDCKEALDYCHLNVSWTHPYNQNSTITAFNIILNSTNNDTTGNIAEILRIVNKTYSPQYEYQIRYIPYSTHYELYVQSVNTEYKSEFANVHVKTADLGEKIDQSPELVNTTDNSVTFKLAPVDRRLKSYALTVAVQDYNKKVKIPQNIQKHPKVADHLCHNFGKTWIAKTLDVQHKNSNEFVTIGTGKESDRKLHSNTSYCLIFIVTNRYKDSEHDVVYFHKLVTPSSEVVDDIESPPSDDAAEDDASDGDTDKAASAGGGSQYTHLYGLLFLLLLIPVGYMIYRYIIKRRGPKPKPQQPKENVYESLPFEQCDENCVSNENYDQLLHK